MENNNKLLFNGLLMLIFGIACLCTYPILSILGFLGTDGNRTVEEAMLAIYFLVLMLPGTPSLIIGISIIKSYIENKKNNNKKDNK